MPWSEFLAAELQVPTYTFQTPSEYCFNATESTLGNASGTGNLSDVSTFSVFFESIDMTSVGFMSPNARGVSFFQGIFDNWGTNSSDISVVVVIDVRLVDLQRVSHSVSPTTSQSPTSR